jgi:hypothetical protein
MGWDTAESRDGRKGQIKLERKTGTNLKEFRTSE